MFTRFADVAGFFVCNSVKLCNFLANFICFSCYVERWWERGNLLLYWSNLIRNNTHSRNSVEFNILSSAQRVFSTVQQTVFIVHYRIVYFLISMRSKMFPKVLDMIKIRVHLHFNSTYSSTKTIKSRVNLVTFDNKNQHTKLSLPHSLEHN